MRQCLSFRFKSRHHRARVHAQLDDFQRHTAANRLFLIRDINHSATAFADFLADFIRPDFFAHFFFRVKRNFHRVRLIFPANFLRAGVADSLDEKFKFAGIFLFARWNKRVPRRARLRSEIGGLARRGRNGDEMIAFGTLNLPARMLFDVEISLQRGHGNLNSFIMLDDCSQRPASGF